MWTGCLLYSEVAACLHQVISLQLSIQCNWDQYTEMFYVTVGCLMAKDRAETSVLVLLDFTAALWGWSTRYSCDDVVGAVSPGIWTRILSGIILVASHALLLLMCLVWDISPYPKLLQCWLKPGVFPWIYMWHRDVEELRESCNQVIFLSSSEHGVLVDICALLRCTPPEKHLTVVWVFFL